MRSSFLLSTVVAAGLFAGCASRDHHHAGSAIRHNHHDGEDRSVVVHNDGSRTYVREYESPRRTGQRYESQLQPRYRGKHPDALGWNDPYWYDSSRY